MLLLNKTVHELHIEGPLTDVTVCFINNPRDPGRDCLVIRATKEDGTLLETEIASVNPYEFELHTELVITFVGQKRVFLHPKV